MILKDLKPSPALFQKIKKLLIHNATSVKVGVVLFYTVCAFGAGALYVIFALSDEISVMSLRPAERRHSSKFNPRISQPERIEIGLSQKDYLKLLKKRNEAMVTGILINEAEEYVPAKIRYKNKTLRVKMRLKGDFTDHLEAAKWSFRVGVKDGEALLGMREFALQHPKTRNYIYEWIFHEILQREGLVGLRTGYVEVVLNGKDLGIYNIEEHFDKNLIENNRFREGPIIKFDEDLLWANRKRNFKNNEYDLAYHNSAIDVFQPGRIKKDPEKRQQFEKAFNLLESFRRGKIGAEEVFDLKKMARYFALSDLLGAWHMLAYPNMRFYYNPITSKLEPIAFDATAGRNTDTIAGTWALQQKQEFYNLYHELFLNEELMALYLAELERIIRPGYLEKHLDEIDEALKKKLNIIYRDFSDFTYDEDIFRQNRELIVNALNPVKGVHAYLDRSVNPQVNLRLGNLETLPITIKGISQDGVMLFRPAEEAGLVPKAFSKPVEYQTMRFEPVGDFSLSEEMLEKLDVEYSITNTSFLKKTKIFPWPQYDELFEKKDFIRQKPNHKTFAFLNVDEKRKEIIIKPGAWILRKDLILPRGYTVIAERGVQMDLRDNAKILSYSPLHFIGRGAVPIVVQSSDGTGQGIAVLDADGWSYFENVVFRGLSAPRHAGWALTGALTFYQSPVKITRCEFLNNTNSDDYLNVVRSEFEVSDSRFFQTFADAVDIDFSRGVLSNLSFIMTGNDAIDFSGSYVTGDKIFINGAKDKGLSAGEASDVRLTEVNIKNVVMALTSKDSSELRIGNAILENCAVGLAIFQKKAEFGPAFAQVQNIARNNIKKSFLIAPGSVLVVNGQRIHVPEK